MANTSDVNVGSFIKYNGETCQVIEWLHRTPGNLRAFYQCKMRVIRTGKLAENRFRSGESIEVIRVEVHPMQYLYKDGEMLVCMNNETFEQVYIPENLFGATANFLKESMEVEIGFEGTEPIFARAPRVVDLQITYTEPGVKGDTANKAMKPATLETGAVVNVPLFINNEEVIRVDTESGQYLERAK